MSINRRLDKEGTVHTYSIQFSSVAQSCLTLCDPMDCSTPGLPVHHQLPEFTQTHVHRMYYSTIKGNKIGSFVEMWMNLEAVVQSQVGQKEKNTMY